MTDEADGDSAAEVGFDQLVGANIRTYRTAAGMSQLELADALTQALGERVHQQTILKIEKGVRPLRFSEARAIARVLRVQDYMLVAGSEDQEARGLLLQLNNQLRNQHASLAELAIDVAKNLVDLAVLASAIGQDDAEGSDSVDLDRQLVVTQTWLTVNWGRDLNREIMSALRQQPFLTDIRDQFDADSYLEVLDRVRNSKLPPIHPSISRLPLLDALKYRRTADDATDT